MSQNIEKRHELVNPAIPRSELDIVEILKTGINRSGDPESVWIFDIDKVQIDAKEPQARILLAFIALEENIPPDDKSDSLRIAVNDLVAAGYMYGDSKYNIGRIARNVQAINKKLTNSGSVTRIRQVDGRPEGRVYVLDKSRISGYRKKQGDERYLRIFRPKKDPEEFFEETSFLDSSPYDIAALRGDQELMDHVNGKIYGLIYPHENEARVYDDQFHTDMLLLQFALGTTHYSYTYYLKDVVKDHKAIPDGATGRLEREITTAKIRILADLIEFGDKLGIPRKS